jgi:Cation efflux system protein CusB domain 1
MRGDVAAIGSRVHRSMCRMIKGDRDMRLALYEAASALLTRVKCNDKVKTWSLGTTLEIEAYVLNQHIGFVRDGQEAVIKIDSFPYTRYGTIVGKVTHVATDAIAGNQAQQNQRDASKPASGNLAITSAAQRTEDLVFSILVAPQASSTNVDARPFRCLPG